jgi:hypothetical protein
MFLLMRAICCARQRYAPALCAMARHVIVMVMPSMIYVRRWRDEACAMMRKARIWREQLRAPLANRVEAAAEPMPPRVARHAVFLHV